MTRKPVPRSREEQWSQYRAKEGAVREVEEAEMGRETRTSPVAWRLEKGNVLEVLDVSSGAKCWKTG